MESRNLSATRTASWDHSVCLQPIGMPGQAFPLHHHTNNGDTFFIDGFTADPVINFGSSTVTVLAVPEPGSAIVLAGLFGAGLLRRRKR